MLTCLCCQTNSSGMGWAKDWHGGQLHSPVNTEPAQKSLYKTLKLAAVEFAYHHA